ncbi:Sugar diacid utilization regulator [Mycobacterium basiliense]|uniref:Sugar diacid utilization regulator n=2 Tax=Mycobacterium basiliense TaxID=2094119 RepID=A0A3S4FQ82_9MYCO|nr:Sugar diacid utilization regulator [Mycobacterium basiliense]
MALNPTPEWLDAVDRATLAANPSIAEDPALAAVVSRSNRSNMIHFAAANLHNPGAPVSPNLGNEQLRMARELVRHGHDKAALDVYRIGQNVALRRWTEIAFELTSDPDELRELLDIPVRSANDFVDATLAGLAVQMQLEHDELTRDVRAKRRKVVELLLEGAPISRERAETQLGYPLEPAHTAAIIWIDHPDADHGQLDRAAEAVSHALGSPRWLLVTASETTRWAWLTDVARLDQDRLHEVFNTTSPARIAIGSTTGGLEGFRRSHIEALTTQRTLLRLGANRRVTCFADIEMVALLTQAPRDTDAFIKNTLGEFESANPALHTTVLTYINQQCNATHAAGLLYIHRNTLVQRLETAQRLLPRPLDGNITQIAVALEVLRWRNNQNGGPEHRH